MIPVLAATAAIAASFSDNVEASVDLKKIMQRTLVFGQQQKKRRNILITFREPSFVKEIFTF